MKEVKKLKDTSIYIESKNILRIGNKAIELAREENRKHGIPEFFCRNGVIYYETPEGGLTTEEPDILKNVKL